MIIISSKYNTMTKYGNGTTSSPLSLIQIFWATLVWQTTLYTQQTYQWAITNPSWNISTVHEFSYVYHLILLETVLLQIFEVTSSDERHREAKLSTSFLQSYQKKDMSFLVRLHSLGVSTSQPEAIQDDNNIVVTKKSHIAYYYTHPFFNGWYSTINWWESKHQRITHGENLHTKQQADA